MHKGETYVRCNKLETAFKTYKFGIKIGVQFRTFYFNGAHQKCF